MASIAKRPLAKGVAFDVRYRDPNGRPRMKTFRRAEDARLFAKTIEADVVRGDYLQPALARSRFDRWADEWLCSTADLRPKTRVGYESMLRVNVLPHFGSWPVGRIEAVHVRQYLADLRSAGAGPGTVRAARKILRLVLATAIEGGALRANPCAGIRLARSEPVEMAFLTMEQVLALAGAMRRPEYGLLVRFAALSGLRAGEIGAMRVGRLDLVRSRVDVAESVAEVTGYGLVYGSPKTYERRSVPIPRTLAEELGAHLDGRPQQPEDFVFTAPGGGPLRHHNFYRRHFKPALAAAGLPQRVRFHDYADLRVMPTQLGTPSSAAVSGLKMSA
ncbi:MAG TPA: tyrosine-type recombinase/integrase [Acidimicrobiales bacterium]|nr:tyrosine-type recombinase/integrase [Acidimicrobiales bacterium]